MVPNEYLVAFGTPLPGQSNDEALRYIHNLTWAKPAETPLHYTFNTQPETNSIHRVPGSTTFEHVKSIAWGFGCSNGTWIAVSNERNRTVFSTRITPSLQDAVMLGQNRVALLKRLKEAKKCLKAEIWYHFKTFRFDFENKRLIGNGGWYLQWLLRSAPSLPVSYENQQTSVGSVFVHYKKELGDKS